MDFRKIFILLMIICTLVAPVTASDDYKIPEAYNDVTINDDGSCTITENITYSITATINGVYRDIPLNDSQSITNISVETPGYYNTLEVINESHNTRLKVWLYKDSQKTMRVGDGDDVRVIFHYNFNKGVRLYNDVVDFQYKSWGDQWNSNVGKLVTTVHVPASRGDTEVFDNPPYYVTNTTWSDDSTIETTCENIPVRTLYEMRILLPTTSLKSSQNALVINRDAKADILRDEEEYQNKLKGETDMTLASSILLAIISLMPLGVYFLFGREPDIDYNTKYEYDLPTNSSYIEVNDIVEGNVGIISRGAFQATILDLIDKKYYKLMHSDKDDCIIRRQDRDTSTLEKYKLDVINYLSGFEDDSGDISMANISKFAIPEGYKTFMRTWKEDASSTVPQSLIDYYFDARGAKYFAAINVIIMTVSVILLIWVFMFDLHNQYSTLLCIISTLGLIWSIILFFVPNTTPGRWTPKGKEYHEKWKSFKRYITDYSQIKENPPASIQVWGKYLIYATALECADTVNKNMEKYFKTYGLSESYIADDDLLRFAYFGGYTHMNDSFNSVEARGNSSDSTGSSGGGGFGGGGGGTF